MEVQGKNELCSILSYHKKINQEVKGFRSEPKTVEEIKSFVLAKYPNLLNESKKHIDQLADLSMQEAAYDPVEDKNYFDHGKNTVYISIGYCVGESL